MPGENINNQLLTRPCLTRDELHETALMEDSVRELAQKIQDAKDTKIAALEAELATLKARLTPEQSDRDVSIAIHLQCVKSSAGHSFDYSECDKLIAAHCLPLRQRIEEAEKFIKRVAYEPIGHAEATDKEILDQLTDEARAFLDTPAERGEGDWMPVLIDSIRDRLDCTRQDFGKHGWRIAKPLNPHPRKIWNAWLVLRGKAFAVEYFEDKIAREKEAEG